jgi:hypothetical protein
MPCGVSDEQDSVVFLIMRKIAAVLVFPLHERRLAPEVLVWERRLARATTRVSKWEDANAT